MANDHPAHSMMRAARSSRKRSLVLPLLRERQGEGNGPSKHSQREFCSCRLNLHFDSVTAFPSANQSIAVATRRGRRKTTTAVMWRLPWQRWGGACCYSTWTRSQRTSGLGLERSKAPALTVHYWAKQLARKNSNTSFEHLEIIPSEMDLCGLDIELARVEDHLQQ